MYNEISLMDYFKNIYSQKKICSFALDKYKRSLITWDKFVEFKEKIYNNKISSKELFEILS